MMISKKNLVLVHGYLGGSDQWASQQESFAADFNVITPDLPGFGLNAHLEAPESIHGFARYVLDELDKQAVSTFHLLGHSMGGMIAQEIMKLAAHRVEKLVLYGTGPLGVMPGRFETIAVSKERLKVEGVASSARRISAKWFIGGEAGTGYEGCADIALMASLQAAVAGLSAMEGWSGIDELVKINSPTLVMWGDQDQSYQWPMPQKLWQDIPNASLSVIAGCSHAMHLEKPDLFNRMLRDFLV